VGLLDEAARFVSGLRGADEPRRAISVSFRSVPPLLAFVNDLFDAVQDQASHDDSPGPFAFHYGSDDRFPDVKPDDDGWPAAADDPCLGLIVGRTSRSAADLVAAEVAQLIGRTEIRDRTTGISRPVAPADVAILFRSRESHRDFEAALEERRVPTYVYKGLGFFDADEVRDATAILRYLADPMSNLRAAAFLRSRTIRLSDAGLTALAPDLAGALLASGRPIDDHLSAEDRRVLGQTRIDAARWLAMVDRVTPAELLDVVLRDSAYAFETRGPRRLQARENLKKLRALIRRIQNRGYATLGGIADHLEQLALGDESNAAIDAIDAVSLMTVHAAKGLEFPIVFLVNLGRGTGAPRAPIRIATSSSGIPAVAVADFQSEADEETQTREAEESKRLLYVALTRARDRLYLSAVVENGVCRMGRGSLGEILPRSFQGLFTEASATSGPLTWTPAGRTHRLTSRSDSSPGGPDAQAFSATCMSN
jgi:ATP-dependent helicase/nuclease subunit A